MKVDNMNKKFVIFIFTEHLHTYPYLSHVVGKFYIKLNHL